MLQMTMDHGSWALALDGAELAAHTPERPFITALRLESGTRTVFGSAREQVREIERIPLTDVAQGAAGETVFRGGDHVATVTVSETDGAARLVFNGEEGLAYELRLPAIDGEAVFGGGAQGQNVNLRGDMVSFFVNESLHLSTTPQKSFISRAIHREKPCGAAASVAPMPVFVTDRGRLILFETTAGGSARFGDSEYLFRFDRCPDALLLRRGADYPTLARILAARFPNRQYLPGWCFDGMILNLRGNANSVLEKTLAMLDTGAAVCCVWSPDWFGAVPADADQQVIWNQEIDKSLRPSLADAIGVLRDHGVRFLCSVSPCLVRNGVLYELFRKNGWLVTRQNGEVYHDKSILCSFGMIDLTNPEALAYVRDVLIGRGMLDLGVSGWMADCGAYPPPDCVLHGGDVRTLRGTWPTLWARVNREAIEAHGDDDAFFLLRGGCPGIQEYAPALWNADFRVGSALDRALPHAMTSAFSLGFSGVPIAYCGALDPHSSGARRQDAEPLIRRMEADAFNWLLPFRESIDSHGASPLDDPAVRLHAVRLSNVRRALRPYFVRIAAQAREGLPAIRPDFYKSMHFSISRDPYSYFLGDDLYVCPVLRRKADRRRVFLPRGVWVHLWSGKVYTGGERYDVPAPPGEIPVFYRADSESIELFREAGAKYNLLSWEGK